MPLISFDVVTKFEKFENKHARISFMYSADDFTQKAFNSVKHVYHFGLSDQVIYVYNLEVKHANGGDYEVFLQLEGNKLHLVNKSQHRLRFITSKLFHFRVYTAVLYDWGNQSTMLSIDGVKFPYASELRTEKRVKVG